MKPPLRKSPTLITSFELAEIVGADQETINNWIRRGMISRAAIGGRQLRARLFSTEEVYKAVITNDLVRLGIQPSSASEAEMPSGKNGKGKSLPKDGSSTRWSCHARRDGLLSCAREKPRGDRSTDGEGREANRLARWNCQSVLLRCFRFPIFLGASATSFQNCWNDEHGNGNY